MENNQATVVYATDIKKASVVYVNTDLNEGRGCQVPIQVCVSETSAKRYAQKRGVQGSNADALAAELKALREQEPVAVYKGHRHIPSDTKEFWGMADNHLPAGTHLYARPIPACELTTSAICELWSEADNINDFGYAIERYLKGERE